MNNLCIVTRSTGIGYCDKSREEHGDYVKVAFLPFSTLTLEWNRKRVNPAMRAAITEHAGKIIDRRGEDYPIDMCGHTVKLGAA